MGKITERRKHKRLKVEDGAFLFFGSDPAMSGKVLDVSKKGIGFTYLASKPRTTKSIDLTLISTLRNFRCSGILGRTASDIQMGKNTINGERRCGIQFEQITEEQASEIEDFIDSCTVGIE